jgi:hypothetical protein
MAKLTLFAILLSFFQLIFGQTEIQITVIDSSTGHVIPFCEIVYNNQGTITNDDGSLILHFKKLPDSIMVYNLAYQRKVFKLKKHQREYLIKMRPKTFFIPEVEILAKEMKLIKKGIYKNKDFSTVNYSRGHLFALYIDNKRNRKGILKELQFYLCKGQTKNPTNTFRVHIYTVDSITKGPKDELLPENIFANAKKGDEWVVVDISKYNIDYPTSGFFIGFELLSNHKTNELVLNDGVYLEENNAVLALSFEKQHQTLTWEKCIGRPWQKMEKRCKDCFHYNAKMACKILIEK